MRKPKIFLNEIEGYGNLAISWYPGPHGDAVEAINEDGVGFFAPNGELLAVEFDEVNAKEDHQFLEFRNYRDVYRRIKCYLSPINPSQPDRRSGENELLSSSRLAGRVL